MSRSNLKGLRMPADHPSSQHARFASGVLAIPDERDSLLWVTANGRNFLLDAQAVVDIQSAQSLAPLPLAKPWAVGVASIKGAPYAVTDLSVLAGAKPTAGGRLVVLSPDVVRGAALLVQDVKGMQTVADIGIGAPVGPEHDFAWVIRDYASGDFLWHLIGPQQLACHPDFSNLQRGPLQ